MDRIYSHNLMPPHDDQLHLFDNRAGKWKWGSGILTSKIRQILKNDVLITPKKLMVMNDR